MIIVYNDLMGMVEVETDGEIMFDNGVAVFDVDGKEYRIPARYIVGICSKQGYEYLYNTIFHRFNYRLYI